MFAALALTLAVVVGARQAPSAPSVPWIFDYLAKNPKTSNNKDFPR